MRMLRNLLTASLPILLAMASPVTAQNPTATTDAARYAARRERAYARLGNDVLVVRSRWTTSDYTEPAFEQDPTFYYFTGADHLLGALLVLDGKARRTELFLPPRLPEVLGPVAENQPKPAAMNAAAVHVDGVADWNAFPRFIQRRLSEGTAFSIQARRLSAIPA